MGWDYRVMRHREGEDQWLSIHEVYYDKESGPNAWSEEGMRPGGNNLVELKGDLLMMMRALERPVLDYEELDNQGGGGEVCG